MDFLMLKNIIHRTTRKYFVGADQTDFSEKIERVPVCMRIEFGVEHHSLPTTGFQEQGTSYLKETF